jgi:hypothetical protein
MMYWWRLTPVAIDTLGPLPSEEMLSLQGVALISLVVAVMHGLCFHSGLSQRTSQTLYQLGVALAARTWQTNITSAILKLLGVKAFCVYAGVAGVLLSKALLAFRYPGQGEIALIVASGVIPLMLACLLILEGYIALSCLFNPQRNYHFPLEAGDA